MRVRSPTRLSRSRLGRLASSSSRRRDRHHAAMARARRAASRETRASAARCRAGRSSPGDARATPRRWSAWITCASMPRCPQPARQPEAVAAGLEGHRDPVDRASGLGRLVAPAMQQRQQRRLVRLQLLGRLPLDARNHRRQPASSTGSSRRRRSACYPGPERRAIGSGHSAAAWGTSVGCFQRRWCLSLAARPIASLAQLGDLRLADARQPHRLHQIVDPPRRHTADPRLLDDRDHRLLRALAGLQERREIAAPRFREGRLWRSVEMRSCSAPRRVSRVRSR